MGPRTKRSDGGPARFLAHFAKSVLSQLVEIGVNFTSVNWLRIVHPVHAWGRRPSQSWVNWPRIQVN